MTLTEAAADKLYSLDDRHLTSVVGTPEVSRVPWSAPSTQQSSMRDIVAWAWR